MAQNRVQMRTVGSPDRHKESLPLFHLYKHIHSCAYLPFALDACLVYPVLVLRDLVPLPRGLSLAAHDGETVESKPSAFRRCQSSLSVTQLSQGRHNPLAKSKGVSEFDPLKRVGDGHIEVLENIIAKLFKFPHFGQAVCRRPLRDRECRCVLESSTNSILNLLFPSVWKTKASLTEYRGLRKRSSYRF